MQVFQQMHVERWLAFTLELTYGESLASVFEYLLTNLGRDTCIAQLSEAMVSKTPIERGQMIAESNDIQMAHNHFGCSGEEEHRSEFHYAALVNVDDYLFELDGRKNRPIPHMKTTDDEFSTDVCSILHQFLARDPEAYGFNFFFLVRKEAEIGVTE